MSADEKILQLKLEMLKLQEQMQSAVVPPAGAAEPALPATDAVAGGLAVADGVPTGLATDASVWFAAVADAADDPLVGGGLLATVLFAGIGALLFEYIATNREPPVPDPLMSGLYGSLHGPVRAASKATDVAAMAVYKVVREKLPF